MPVERREQRDRVSRQPATAPRGTAACPARAASRDRPARGPPRSPRQETATQRLRARAHGGTRCRRPGRRAARTRRRRARWRQAGRQQGRSASGASSPSGRADRPPMCAGYCPGLSSPRFRGEGDQRSWWRGSAARGPSTAFGGPPPLQMQGRMIFPQSLCGSFSTCQVWPLATSFWRSGCLPEAAALFCSITALSKVGAGSS